VPGSGFSRTRSGSKCLAKSERPAAAPEAGASFVKISAGCNQRPGATRSRRTGPRRVSRPEA